LQRASKQINEVPGLEQSSFWRAKPSSEKRKELLFSNGLITTEDFLRFQSSHKDISQHTTQIIETAEPSACRAFCSEEIHNQQSKNAILYYIVNN